MISPGRWLRGFRYFVQNQSRNFGGFKAPDLVAESLAKQFVP